MHPGGCRHALPQALSQDQGQTHLTEGSISAQLDADTLAARIRDHGRETQLFLNSVLVSVAVANAAYVFALLLGSGITPMLWLPFMLASFGFVLVTFSGTSNTSLMVVSLPDWRDGVLPLLQAMTVFLMFSMLMPAHSTMPLLSDWYAVVAAHAFIGGFWIRSLAARIRETRYDAAVRDAVEAHLKSMHGSALCGDFERQLLVGDMVDDSMVGAS